MSLSYVRARFLDMISAYSESQYAAGWKTGIELDIRTDEQNLLWLAVAGACQGWPLGYRAATGWDPLTDEEQVRLRELMAPALDQAVS